MEAKLQSMVDKMGLGVDCKFDFGPGSGFVKKSILFKDEEKLKRIWFVVTKSGKVALLKVCPDWVDVYFESIILADKVFVVWDEKHRIVEWFLVDKKFKDHKKPHSPCDGHHENKKSEFDEFSEKDY